MKIHFYVKIMIRCNVYDKVRDQFLNKRKIKLDGKEFQLDLIEKDGEIILTKNNIKDVQYVTKRYSEHAHSKYGLPLSINLFNIYPSKKPFNKGYNVLSIKKKSFIELENYINNYQDSNKVVRDYNPSAEFKRDLQYFNNDVQLYEQEEKNLNDLKSDIDNYSPNIEKPPTVSMYTHSEKNIEFVINGLHHEQIGDKFFINGEEVTIEQYMEGFDIALLNYDLIKEGNPTINDAKPYSIGRKVYFQEIGKYYVIDMDADTIEKIEISKEEFEKNKPIDNYSPQIIPSSTPLPNLNQVETYKNSYVELFNYKNELLKQTKRYMYETSVEINKTTDTNKKAELIDILQELKDALHGNFYKNIIGLQNEIEDISKIKDKYNALLDHRKKLEKGLEIYLSQGLDTTVIESQLMQNALDIYNLKQDNLVDIYRASALQDLARLERLINSGKLEDLVKAKQITNFYIASDPNNQDTNNPLFSREELINESFDTSMLEDIQKISNKAKNLENKLNQISRNTILNYINGLDKFLKQNNNRPLSEEQVFKDKDGLLDISLLDRVISNIQDNPFSQTQSILQNAIFSALENSLYQEQANIKSITDELDDANPKAAKELLRLGYKLSDNSVIGSLKYRVLGRFNNTPDFSIFKQISKEGLYRNRLVQRESDSYRNMIIEAREKLDRDLANPKKDNTQAYHAYHNKIRKSSEIIKPHLLEDIVSDPKYSSLLDANTKTNIPESYKQDLINKLGVKGYEDILNKQRQALDNYLVDIDRMEKSLLLDYAAENGLDSIDNLGASDLNIERQKILQSFIVDKSPMYNGLLFEENRKVKLGDKRYNNYNLEHSIFIPRATEVDIKYKKAYDNSVSPNFKLIDLVPTNKQTNYYDERYKKIEDNDILHNFWKVAMKTSEYYQQSLSINERQKWQPGDLPIDDNVLLDKFEESSDKTKDKILYYLSKSYRNILKNIYKSISNTMDVPYSNYNYSNNNLDINTSSLNRGNRAIKNEIALKKIELKRHLKEDFDQPKAYKDILFLESIPIDYLKEALYLYGLNKYNIQRMSESEVYSNYVNSFGLTANRQGRYSTNILQVLEDLHIQNALKQSNGDLGLSLLKSATLASGIIARRKNLDMIQFMVDAFNNIKLAKTNSFNTQYLNRRTGQNVIGGSIRNRAVGQMSDFIKGVLTLRGSGTDNHLIANREEAENLKTNNFFHKYVLDEGKDLDLIDNLLENPKVSEEDKAELGRIKAQKIRYFDGVKGVLRPVSTLLRLSALGYKTLSNFVNLYEGTKQLIIHDTTGQDWEPGKITEALGIMKGAFLRNFTQFGDKLLKDNKSITPQASKARFIIDRLDFIEDASSLEAKALKKNTARGVASDVLAGLNPYVLIKKIEYVNQGSVALAMLMSQEITNSNTGEVTSVWDALDNRGKLKDGFRTEENINTWEKFESPQAIDFKAKLNSARNKTSGDYTQIGESALNQHWGGKLILNFKKWMPKYISQIYGNHIYDYDSGKYIKGRAKSLHPAEMVLIRVASAVTMRNYGLSTLFAVPFIVADFYGYSHDLDPNKPQLEDMFKRLSLMSKVALKTMVGFPINLATTGVFTQKPLIDTSSDKIFGKSLETKLQNKGIKPEDIGNIKAMGVELGMNILLAAGLILVYGTLIAGEDDDEENKTLGYSKSEWSNITQNTIYPLLQQGEAFYSNPIQAFKSINGIPLQTYIEQLQKTANNINKILHGLDTNYISRGRDARSYKTDKLIKKLTPVPFRDIDSRKYIRFEEYIPGQQIFLKDKIAEKNISNIRSEIKNNMYQQITPDNIESKYSEYDIEFKSENKDGETYSFEELRTKLLDKVMKRDYPKPNLQGLDPEDALKDIKDVRDGNMTSEQWKNKYSKEED